MLDSKKQAVGCPDPLLALSDVLKLVRVAESTWWAGISTGRFPRPVKCGRRSFWPQSQIAEFIEALKRETPVACDKAGVAHDA